MLQNLLKESAYQLVPTASLADLPQRMSQPDWLEPDTWLVDLGSDVQDAIALLVEHSDTPLLINEAMPPETEPEAFQAWRRRLLKKLETVAVAKSDAEAETSLAVGATDYEQVWVLAASMGGPDAVRDFLDQLDDNLPIAMVYAQHTAKAFDRQLGKTVGRNQRYPMRLVSSEQRLSGGEVTVIPVDRQVRFLDHGRVVATRQSWQGFYQPTIDQVISELARLYRQRLGVIVFSGMCDDGAAGCRVVKACGGTVWVQQPDSCISPDMPEAALATGCVSYQGSPQQLAEKMNSLVSVEA